MLLIDGNYRIRQASVMTLYNHSHAKRTREHFPSPDDIRRELRGSKCSPDIELDVAFQCNTCYYEGR